MNNDLLTAEQRRQIQNVQALSTVRRHPLKVVSIKRAKMGLRFFERLRINRKHGIVNCFHEHSNSCILRLNDDRLRQSGKGLHG